MGLLSALVLGFVAGLGSDNVDAEAKSDKTVLGGSNPPKDPSNKEMWCLAMMI